MTDYPILIAPLSDEDGGGFVGFAPDLLGCMSDGETQQEALANTIEAVREWIETAERRNLPIPAPGTSAVRAKNEREALANALRNAVANFDAMDSRLDDLEDLMRRIESRLDHDDAWQRFADTAVISAIDRKVKLLS